MPRLLTGTNSFGASPQILTPQQGQQQQGQGMQEYQTSSAAAAAAAAIAAVPLPPPGASLSPSSPSKHLNKEHKKMPAVTAASLPEHLASSFLPTYTPPPAHHHHHHQHSMATVPELGHPAGHVLVPAAAAVAPGASPPTTPSSLAQAVHPVLQRQVEQQQDQIQQLEQGNGPVGQRAVAAAPSPTCPPQPLQMSRSVQSIEQSPQQVRDREEGRD